MACVWPGAGVSESSALVRKTPRPMAKWRVGGLCLAARVCVRARVALCSDDRANRVDMEAGDGAGQSFRGMPVPVRSLSRPKFVANERETPSVANVGGRVWSGKGGNECADKRERATVVGYLLPSPPSPPSSFGGGPRQEMTRVRDSASSAMPDTIKIYRPTPARHVWSGPGGTEVMGRKRAGAPTKNAQGE